MRQLAPLPNPWLRGIRWTRVPDPPLDRRSKVKGVAQPYEVDGSLPIVGLKALVCETCEVNAEEQRLLYKGRTLRDEVTLDEAKVVEGAVLHLVKTASTSSGGSASSPPIQLGATPPSPPQDPMAALMNTPAMEGMLSNPDFLEVSAPPPP